MLNARKYKNIMLLFAQHHLHYLFTNHLIAYKFTIIFFFIQLFN